jgi:DNA-binding transcriptional regulator YhcF (GntR family)
VRIDRSGGAPPWRQLADGLARLIERGRLLPGDRVPTVRGLAEELDLAPNTVARAYAELEAAGWLQGRGRAGTFVARSLPVRPRGADAALARAADAYLRRAAQLGFDEEDARKAVGASIAAKKSSSEAPT